MPDLNLDQKFDLQLILLHQDLLFFSDYTYIEEGVSQCANKPY